MTKKRDKPGDDDTPMFLMAAKLAGFIGEKIIAAFNEPDEDAQMVILGNPPAMSDVPGKFITDGQPESPVDMDKFFSTTNALIGSMLPIFAGAFREPRTIISIKIVRHETKRGHCEVHNYRAWAWY